MQADANPRTIPPIRTEHLPIYWFGRLVQAAATGDTIERFNAQTNLQKLGWDVRPAPLPTTGGQA